MAYAPHRGMGGFQEQEWHLGQKEEDHERIFPKYTNAQAAVVKEMHINGRAIPVWDFAQLDSLSVPVLKQRAQAIRDAMPEGECPPQPSAQRQCLVRWILHMQSTLCNEDIKPGRQGPGVPESFLKEHKERPIGMERAHSPKGQQVPFGPRGGHTHTATRDHFGDLLAQRKEFEQHPHEGIQSLKVGGEGRKYADPGDHFKDGVADVDPKGIQSLKPGGEGRRYIGPVDHLHVDLRQDNPPVERKGNVRTMMTEHHMVDLGTAAPGREPNVGGERKRHIDRMMHHGNAQSETVFTGGYHADHMMNHGVADTQPQKNEIEAGANHGRRYVDRFSGASEAHKGLDKQHRPHAKGWKQDPSRLMGTSMIC